MEIKSKLMDEAAMNRALMRISHEIVERNRERKTSFCSE